jgi:AAA15 family ATPase/GTPase
MSFLQGLGTGIKDINIVIKKKQLQINELPPFLADEVKAQIVKNLANEIKANVMYDSFQVDLMLEESMGVKKLIEFICPFIDIIVKGKVLICDELEANLHEAIVYGLVDLFRQLRTNESAQMFFTTHDTSILNLDLFRRDQIWFTEMKRGERTTDLYSLAEIKNVRKDENIGKGYISGKYGAIPMLNESLASLISKVQTEGE